MEFPRFVFQATPDGKTAKHELVHTETEHVEALGSGWFSTVPEALAAASAASVSAAGAGPAGSSTNSKGNADDEARPPTREEIEAKARELGLSFQPNISSKKLLQRIEIALAGRQ